MPSTWYIKRGDTWPVLTASLTDATTGAAIDLTSVTAVKLLLRLAGTTTPYLEKTGAISSPASGGVVTYTFVAGDWTGSSALAPGTYEAEWQLTYTGGGIRTAPTEAYFHIEIYDDIN